MKSDLIEKTKTESPAGVSGPIIYPIELILKSAGEGIYGLDKNGKTTFVNPAAERMTGFSAEEMIGECQHKLVHHSTADGKEYSHLNCPIYAAFKDGKVYQVSDEVFWRKDGTSFPVEYFSTPVRENGKVVGAVVVFKDITERKKSEEEIQKLRQQLELENAYLNEEVLEAQAYGDIIGQGPALKNVMSQIELVAPTDASVLIIGESGTGKELVAREIHKRSSRSRRAMIKVNCASIPRELYESEFFGHVKGSFTGAVRDRAGRFELADGGTLLLDEVGEIPLELQAKLLRVLQEGQYERVGDEVTRKVDVRIIAATNRDLKKEAEAGRFRQDLYYRLNVFPIEVVPFRQHKEDIPLLAAHFLEITSKKLNLPKPRLTQANVLQLQRYDWPGNVRELQNVIERAVITARSGRLRFDLPQEMNDAGRKTLGLKDTETDDAFEIVSEAEMKQRERRNILAALKQSRWKIYGADGAAALLDVRPTTLASRIKKLGLKKTETAE